MTAPGDSTGEGNDRPPEPPSGGSQPAEQPVSDAPWASPSSYPVVDYPPPADYPPSQEGSLPGYPDSAADYPPGPAAGYPPDPATSYPPAGYPPGPAGYPSFGHPPPGYQPYGAPPQGFAGYSGPAPFPAPPPMPGPYGAYPGGYHPGPDYGSGYGAMQTGTNTMAIISLVAGIVGVFCLHRLDRGRWVRHRRNQPDQANPRRRLWPRGSRHRDQRGNPDGLLHRGDVQHRLALRYRNHLAQRAPISATSQRCRPASLLSRAAQKSVRPPVDTSSGSGSAHRS